MCWVTRSATLQAGYIRSQVYGTTYDLSPHFVMGALGRQRRQKGRRSVPREGVSLRPGGRRQQEGRQQPRERARSQRRHVDQVSYDDVSRKLWIEKWEGLDTIIILLQKRQQYGVKTKMIQGLPI